MNKFFTILLIAFFCVGTVFAQGNTPNESGRSMEEIRESISDLQEIISSDYEVLLAEDPEATGTITLKFSIAPDGSLLEPVVECSETLISLNEPVLEALKNLEFSPDEEQVDNIPVTVPITLLPPQ